MVRQLHNGMTARITDNGVTSEAFAVTNGVKQGCVLTPILFSLMLTAMPIDVYRDKRPGICATYCTTANSSIIGGCISSRVAKIDDEVARQISEAIQASVRLQNTVWNRHGLHLRTSTDAAVWSGDLDSVRAAGAKAQPLPPPLSLKDNKAEVASDSDHGCTGMDRNPQHLRHAETAASALERPSLATGLYQLLSPPPTLPHPPRRQLTLISPPQPSSSVASTSATEAPASATAAQNSDAPANTNLTIVNTSDVDLVHTGPHCDRTFASHTGLAGYSHRDW
nr:unnamed protein product [Spirometra erinaceieuropaei]